MHRNIFRLQLANNRVSTKNLPPQKNCHSPLPDWIADAGQLAWGVDMGAPQDSRRGILAINSNSN